MYILISMFIKDPPFIYTHVLYQRIQNIPVKMKRNSDGIFERVCNSVIRIYRCTYNKACVQMEKKIFKTFFIVCLINIRIKEEIKKIYFHITCDK